MAVRPTLNLRVSDRLLDDGLITQADHRRAVDYARGRGRRIEEALLELDVIAEVELLRYLAKMHRTQFVSTERMSKAKLDAAALRMVPKKLAELYGLFPLLFDAASQRLVVATADPDNLSAIDDLKAATPARDVRALVARPAAVIAAVARGYDGDKFAFTNLLREVDSFGGLQLGSPFAGAPAAGAAEPAAPQGRAPAAPGRRAAPVEESVFRGRAGGRPVEEPVRAPPAARPEVPARDARREPTPLQAPELPPRRPRVATPRQAPEPPPAARRGAAKRLPELSDTMRSYRDDELIGGRPPAVKPLDSEPPPALKPESVPPDDPTALDDPFAVQPGLAPLPRPMAAPRVAEIEALAPSTRSIPPPPSRLNMGPLSRRSDRPPALSSQVGMGQLVEALRVLVGLLENEREDLRGHSSMVARLVQDACERIGLSDAHTVGLVVAAHLHDLGKRGAMGTSRRRSAARDAVHITALNVAHQKTVQELARKLYDLPTQLMEAAGLPEQTKAAIRTMYEHVDGRGVPAGIIGKDIPIGGRILAVADTYADLTHNASNTYGRVLSPEQAMDVLKEHTGTVFDGNIVEVFGHAMTGEQILSQLLDERHRVLIVDPDPEQTLVLQLRLSDQGFDVHLARDTKEARAALAARKFALVVSEVDLEEQDAGLFLREEVAKSDQGRDLCWVFLSGRSSRNTLRRAFDIGVDDFISKPASVEIVVAKLIQLVERGEAEKPTAPRGVSGSLSDMAMTDIVQILFHGQRTCALHIEWPECRGEIHFQSGRIVHALVGELAGENAFYRMLSLGEDGQFRVDPSFTPTGEPTIKASPEGLLLEGMRLLDEGLVP